MQKAAKYQLYQQIAFTAIPKRTVKLLLGLASPINRPPSEGDMRKEAHVSTGCTLILNRQLSRNCMKLFKDPSLGSSNVIAQQSHSVRQGAWKLENAGA